MDDELLLAVEARAPHDARAPQRVHALLTQWDGTPVAGVRMAWTVTCAEAAGAEGPTLHRGVATTRAAGIAVFCVPHDAGIANLPGAHRVTIRAEIPTSDQGDAELAEASALHGHGLP